MTPNTDHGDNVWADSDSRVMDPPHRRFVSASSGEMLTYPLAVCRLSYVLLTILPFCLPLALLVIGQNQTLARLLQWGKARRLPSSFSPSARARRITAALSTQPHSQRPTTDPANPAGVSLPRLLSAIRPMAAPLAAVVRLAAVSRALVLALSLLARLLFRPYDTSASLHPPCLSSPSSHNSTAAAAAAAISSLAVWDGVHFARSAECGYEYEQSFAFLPLLPVSMALLSRTLFAPLVPALGYRAVLVISGHVLNNVAFVAAAAYFYRLSVLILKDSGAAYRASVLFCFNPASVFYSSLYSESLYALFSLGGLFYLFSGANTVAMIMLAVSGSARSNGALNAGYFCFQALLQAYDAAIQKKRPILAVQALITGFLRSTFIFIPFFAFQAYGYLNICLHGNSDELRPWCKAKLPLLYSFIQSHYWGVGFLRYFQMKQLPNFLLASPVLSLAVYSIAHYTKMLHQLFQSNNIHEKIIVTVEGRSVELCESSDVATVLKSAFSSGLNNKKQALTEVKKRKSAASEATSASLDSDRPTGRILKVDKEECPILVLPFILHLTFMTFTAFFVMHVQVSTRFLSASPPIYWAASHILVSPRGSSKRWGYFIVVYFIAYILLGSLLFPNFYPFT